MKDVGKQNDNKWYPIIVQRLDSILPQKRGLESMALGVPTTELLRKTQTAHQFSVLPRIALGLDGMVADYRALPLSEQAIDVILAIDIFSVEYALSDVVAELKRVLRHDGEIIIVGTSKKSAQALPELKAALTQQGLLVGQAFYYPFAQSTFKLMRFAGSLLGALWPGCVQAYMLRVIKHDLGMAPIELKWQRQWAFAKAQAKAPVSLKVRSKWKK